ncbi:MAG: ATP-binding protein [Acidimicrobiales bacterium]|nr:ATP-binding protein [Acidimicrobiales bacterium]
MADDVLIELDLPPRPESVSVARLVVGSLALADPSFDEERTSDLRLAVSEACTNAMLAQAVVDDSRPIELRYRVSAASIEVSVRDRAGGFDLDAAQRVADLTDPKRLEYEGGLGIPLIKLLADEAEFRRLEDGTEVVMTFGPESPTGRLVG